MREGSAINRALLAIDEQQATTIYQKLREMPAVAAVNLRHTLIDSFNETLQRVLLTFTLINAILGAVIAFGVVYTRNEAAYILLGELATLTLISLPLGVFLGWACVNLCRAV